VAAVDLWFQQLTARRPIGDVNHKANSRPRRQRRSARPAVTFQDSERHRRLPVTLQFIQLLYVNDLPQG